MISISLCMIVKDEEDVLARCLESVASIADEIIIADTGSTDRTVEIAKKYTDQIYHFDWIDDFSAARNFAFSKATQDYCLWLDADDILTEPNRQAFLQLKETLPSNTDLVMMRYHTAFDSDGNPVFSYYRERLLRRQFGFRWVGAVHEVIPPAGKILYSDIAITHQKIKPGNPDRNLQIYQKMLDSKIRLDPRQQFYYAQELMDHRLFPQAEQALKQFLDLDGWTENQIDACRKLSACCRAQHKDEELNWLFQSFVYDLPRAETCCEIGQYYFNRNDYTRAAYWYEQALRLPRPDQLGGFVQPDCYGFIPATQLSVCYYRLGNLSQAKKYHQLSGSYKPNDPTYLSNRQFFKDEI